MLNASFSPPPLLQPYSVSLFDICKASCNSNLCFWNEYFNIINLGCSIFQTGKDLFSCVLKSFVQRDRCVNTNKQNQLKSYFSANFLA